VVIKFLQIRATGNLKISLKQYISVSNRMLVKAALNQRVLKAIRDPSVWNVQELMRTEISTLDLENSGAKSVNLKL
jgi:hypothetical protein